MGATDLTARHVFERQQALREAQEQERDIWRATEDATDLRDAGRLYDHPHNREARERTAQVRDEVLGLREEIGGKVYRVANENLSALQDRIEKLNRKAAKLGTASIELTVTDETEQIKRARGEVQGDIIYDFTYVVLRGETPMVPGYAFVAALDHTADQGADESVGIHRVPAFGFFIRNRRDLTEEQAKAELEAINLDGFRHAENVCEHCGLKRQRNTTFVLYELTTGGLKQVGSTCLRDYTGANDPERVASWAEWLAALDEDLEIGGDPDAESMLAGGGRVAISTRTYLAHVVAAIEDSGWQPRWLKDDYGYGSDERNPAATADQAHRAMRASKPEFEVTDEHYAEADRALEWVREELADDGDLDEFQHNLVTYARANYLPEKGDGIVAYIPMAYRRELERRIQAELAAKAKAASDHFGEEGDRIKGLTFTVSFVRGFEGNYGMRYLTKGATPDGNLILWWAGRELEQGKTYQCSATIKRHSTDDYNDDAKITELTNCRGIKEIEDPDGIERVTDKTAAQRLEEKQAREAREAAKVEKRQEELREQSDPDTGLACLDREIDECDGAVEYRMPLSSTGSSFPRCEKHWERRLAEQERIQERYGGVAAPSDFDPSYANERWDSDY